MNWIEKVLFSVCFVLVFEIGEGGLGMLYSSVCCRILVDQAVIELKYLPASASNIGKVLRVNDYYVT